MYVMIMRRGIDNILLIQHLTHQVGVPHSSAQTLPALGCGPVSLRLPQFDHVADHDLCVHNDECPSQTIDTCIGKQSSVN